MEATLQEIFKDMCMQIDCFYTVEKTIIDQNAFFEIRSGQLYKGGDNSQLFFLSIKYINSEPVVWIDGKLDVRSKPFVSIIDAMEAIANEFQREHNMKITHENKREKIFFAKLEKMGT